MNVGATSDAVASEAAKTAQDKVIALVVSAFRPAKVLSS